MGMLKSNSVHPSYQTASGPIPYNLTNDYMFHIVLQGNEFVLRGLIGSLLHLDQSEIKSVGTLGVRPLCEKMNKG